MEPPDVDIPEPIRKNFSAKQLALVVELRNKIQDALTTPELKNWCNDACISRYLRAREWNLEAAEKMLRNTLKWREEYKPHLIRFEEVKDLLDFGALYPNGFDKQDRPVIILKPGGPNPHSVEARLKSYVYIMESLIKKMKPGVEKMVWIVDFSEYHFGQTSSESKKVSKISMQLLQDHYPERLGVAFIVNPPWYFTLLYKIVSPFMTEETKRKFHFISHGGEKLTHELLEYIDEAQLDARYGGKNTAKYTSLQETEEAELKKSAPSSPPGHAPPDTEKHQFLQQEVD